MGGYFLLCIIAPNMHDICLSDSFRRGLFCYIVGAKEASIMGGYDNDTLLLFLDDDLFPKEEENDVGTLESESEKS